MLADNLYPHRPYRSDRTYDVKPFPCACYMRVCLYFLGFAREIITAIRYYYDFFFLHRCTSRFCVYDTYGIYLQRNKSNILPNLVWKIRVINIVRFTMNINFNSLSTYLSIFFWKIFLNFFWKSVLEIPLTINIIVWLNISQYQYIFFCFPPLNSYFDDCILRVKSYHIVKNYWVMA